MTAISIKDNMISDFSVARPTSSQYAICASPLNLVGQHDLQTESMQPSIDSPPSSVSIRAYTEQMKMKNQRTLLTMNSVHDTTSSTTSSFIHAMSRTNLCATVPQRSRRSSNSNLYLTSARTDRPDSMLKLGKTFLAKVKNQSRDSSRSPSAMSTARENGEEVGSSRTRKNSPHGTTSLGSSRNNSRSNLSLSAWSSSFDRSTKLHISSPFDFQHVTHTVVNQKTNKEVENVCIVGGSSRTGTFKQTSVDNSNCLPHKITEQHVRADKSTKGNKFHNASGKVQTSSSNLQNVSDQRAQPDQASYDYSVDVRKLKKPSRKPSRDMLQIFRPSELVDEIMRPRTGSQERRSPSGTPLPISQPTPLKHSTDDYFFQSDKPSVYENHMWPLTSPSVQEIRTYENDVESPRSEHRNARLFKAELIHHLIDPSLSFERQAEESSQFPNMLEAPLDTCITGMILEAEAIGLAISPDERTNSVETTIENVVATKAPQDAWEDDIDYCYEHGIEASAEHEWRTSISQLMIAATEAEAAITAAVVAPLTISKCRTPTSRSEKSSREPTTDFPSPAFSPLLLVPLDFGTISNAATATKIISDEYSHFPDIGESYASHVPMQSRSSSVYYRSQDSPRLSRRNSGFSRSSHLSQTTSSSRYSSRYSNTTWGSTTFLPRTKSQDMLCHSREHTEAYANRCSVADIVNVRSRAASSATTSPHDTSPTAIFTSPPPTSLLPALPPIPASPLFAGGSGNSHHSRNGSAPLRPKTANSAACSTSATTTRSRSGSLASRKLRNGSGGGGYALFPSV